MTVLSALQRCFGAGPAKIHAAGPLEEEHEIALKAAEALLNTNAQHKVTDLYTLAAPIGHGAFAKVVECSSKVRLPDKSPAALRLLVHLPPIGDTICFMLYGCIHCMTFQAADSTSNVMTITMQATGDKYACKILPGKTTQGDRRSHIIREIAILQRVGKHPYTLTFHDAFEDSGKFYLIMEMCTGGELFDQIMQKVSSGCLSVFIVCHAVVNLPRCIVLHDGHSNLQQVLADRPSDTCVPCLD